MLSPNAMNFVRVMTGAAATVTPNVQDAVRCRVSVAVQVTIVVPIGNSAWLAGLHDDVIGGAPLVVVTEPYVTGVGWLFDDVMVTGLGQLIRGPSGN
jgi:hypothetical protein